MIEVNCPVCGTDDHRHGSTQGDKINVACTACELSWDRLTSPHCERCGGQDMVCVPEVLVERSRGTQLSIMGEQPHYLCRFCDGDELATPRHGRLPNMLGGQSLSERR